MKQTAASLLLLLAAVAPARADLVVSKAPTSNVSCVAGVCTATAAKAVLNAGDLAAMLASGDVTLESGALAKGINIHAGLSWASASRLTLEAKRAVSVTQPVIVEGPGGLTISANSGYGITGKGRVEFKDLSSSLIIDGQSYTLVNSVAGLAAVVAADFHANVALAQSYDAGPDKTYRKPPVPTVFNGNFEGLGNSVSHLKLEARGTRSTDAIGLFADVDVSAVLRDIRMVDTVMTSSVESVGAGALAAYSGGTIVNAYASGRFQSVAGRDITAGGLVGENGGTIVSSHSDVTLAAVSGDVGGLVGFNEGPIRDCSAGGAVSGSVSGGLVGDNEQPSTGTIANSYATGAVQNGGGLVGVNTSTIQDSYATGNVTGDFAGGLVGGNAGTILASFATGTATATAQGTNAASAGGLVAMLYQSTLHDSYATGAVSATAPVAYAGGLIGWSDSVDGASASIRNVYSTGSVSSSDLLGGLIGRDDEDAGYIATAYWDLETSGVSNLGQGAGQPANDPGITGLSDTALKSGLPAGFDPAVWAQSPSINNGFPYLIANPPQ